MNHLRAAAVSLGLVFAAGAAVAAGSRFGPKPAGGGRAPRLPGGFHILVVGK